MEKGSGINSIDNGKKGSGSESGHSVLGSLHQGVNSSSSTSSIAEDNSTANNHAKVNISVDDDIRGEESQNIDQSNNSIEYNESNDDGSNSQSNSGLNENKVIKSNNLRSSVNESSDLSTNSVNLSSSSTGAQNNIQGTNPSPVHSFNRDNINHAKNENNSPKDSLRESKDRNTGDGRNQLDESSNGDTFTDSDVLLSRAQRLTDNINESSPLIRSTDSNNSGIDSISRSEIQRNQIDSNIFSNIKKKVISARDDSENNSLDTSQIDSSEDDASSNDDSVNEPHEEQGSVGNNEKVTHNLVGTEGDDNLFFSSTDNYDIKARSGDDNVRTGLVMM